MAAPSIVVEQQKPGAATDQSLYTVPAGRRFSGLCHICNQGPINLVRIWIRKNGAGTSLPQYLYYDLSVAATTRQVTPNIKLAAGDILSVRSDLGDVSFTANGYEDDVPTS